MVKTMFYVAAATVSLSLACIAGAATAPQASKSASDTRTLPPYETLDANGDGIVTLPEVVVYSPSLAKRIHHCDVDRNNNLSRAEYAACKPTTTPAIAAKKQAVQEKARQTNRTK